MPFLVEGCEIFFAVLKSADLKIEIAFFVYKKMNRGYLIESIYPESDEKEFIASYF